jgi:hypothetical protein
MLRSVLLGWSTNMCHVGIVSSASTSEELLFPRTVRIVASSAIVGLTLFGPTNAALTTDVIAANDTSYTVDTNGAITTYQSDVDIGLTAKAAIASITLADTSIVPRLRILDQRSRSLWWSNGVVSDWPAVGVPKDDPDMQWQANTAPTAVGSSASASFLPEFAFDTSTNLTANASGRAWVANTNSQERAYVQLPAALSLLQVAIINMVDIASEVAFLAFGVRGLRIYVTDTNPGSVFGQGITQTDLIFDGEIAANTINNSGVNRTYVVPDQVRRGRYVIFDAVSSWGAERIGIRRIELHGYS